MADDNDWAHKLIDDALGQVFYGELTFSFHAGRVRKAAKIETLIAPDIMAQKAKSLRGPRPDPVPIPYPQKTKP